MSRRIRLSPRRALAAFRGAPVRLGIVAAIVAFAVLAGTSASYAYFQMTQGATTSATAGTLAISSTNFTSLAYTFRNDQIDTAGSVTVTNTSDTADGIARTATVVLSATGDATALTAIKFVAWVRGATETCAIGHSKTGAVTWATGATLTASLTPSASATWCIESYVTAATDLADTDGALSITPRVAASVAAGGWTAATAATTTEASVGIYPAFTGMTTDWSYVRPANVGGTRYCMDVSGLNGGPVDGTHVISWPCKNGTTTNQIWKFIADGSYFSLQPNNSQTRRATPSATSSGSFVQINPVGTDVAQDWQVQRIASGLYQFVNRSTGLCLSATTPSGDTTSQPCTDVATTQRWVVSPYLATASCTYAQTAANTGRLTLNWTTTNTQTMKFFVNGAQVTPTAVTATSATITVANTGGAVSLSMTDSSSALSAAAGDTQLGFGSVTVGTVNGSCSLTNMVN